MFTIFLFCFNRTNFDLHNRWSVSEKLELLLTKLILTFMTQSILQSHKKNSSRAIFFIERKKDKKHNG